MSNRFNNLIADLTLIELPLHNRKYTWARSSTSSSKALLDRFLCTSSWLNHYSSSLVHSLPRVHSDHNPLILQTDSITTTINKNIKFDKNWLNQEGFIDLVIHWWSELQLTSDIGNSWKYKLQHLRRKLRGWSFNLQGEKKRLKVSLLAKIDHFELLNESNSLSSSDFAEWEQCKIALHNLYHQEESHWQQRAKLKWFLEGDQNTKFFHLTATQRQRKNTILSLEINGSLIFDTQIIRDHITSYYKNLLGQSEPRLISLGNRLWSTSEQLTPLQQSTLEIPFTLEEIKTTLFSCNPSKSPGPDGISFLFYQTFWDTISPDILTIFQSFYSCTLDISKFNLASICLIPKKEDANNIKHFRPISLINCSFKLITKLLANRLSQVMDPLIDDSQSAYIKGRLIGDNIITAHELLHHVRITKQKGILLKLDFEKAFDKVNWDFLLEILKARGFGSLFINWINNILQGSRTCISFNGTLGNYFTCKKGLRQGDPLSPFLFDLVADALNKMLKKAQAAGKLQGLGQFSNSTKILNLHFADDTLIFLEADPLMLENLKFLLLGFEDVSGLKINFDKSAMIPLNISSSLALSLSNQLGCQISSLPITYLGVPLHWKTLNTTDWNPLVSKIEKKLQTWKGSLLSLGGRVTLLNSVISALPLYWLSIYKIPVTVCSKIDKIRKKFLWSGSSAEKRKYHLIAWEYVCLGKDQGGLGVLNLTRMNTALLAKWGYRFKDPTVKGQWKELLSIKYGTSGLDFYRPSHFWKGIISLRTIFDLGINRIVQNGQDTAFWLDRWQGECSLYCTYPNLFRASNNPTISVSNAFSTNSQLSITFSRQLTGILLVEWNNLRNNISFTPTDAPDLITWRWTTNGQFTVNSLYKWLEYGGMKNRSFITIWRANIPLKIKVFLWLLKHDRILTKENLLNKGWTGNTACIFCGEFESANHLFVNCYIAQSIWSWIANHNGFHFNCETIEDLWYIDSCIPLKDRLLVELVRAATLWTLWLTRNKVCFDNIAIPTVASISSSIISLASFWCKVKNDDTYFKLTLILPMTVCNLTQVGMVPLMNPDSIEDGQALVSGEEEPGHARMDLSEFLINRVESSSMDSSSTGTHPSVDPTVDSYMDYSSASTDD